MPSNEPHAGEYLLENLRQQTCLSCGSRSLGPFFAIDQVVRSLNEYEHSIIAVCGDCGHGHLERTYYDSTDGDDILDQTEWYLLDKDSMKRIADFIVQKGCWTIGQRHVTPCPEPLSPNCFCAVHWQLLEASKKFEPLTDAELVQNKGTASAEFMVAIEGAAMFLKRGP